MLFEQEVNWKWRPPPRGHTSDSYAQCKNWLETSNCAYGILCTEAHGIEELEEWKERFHHTCREFHKASNERIKGESYAIQLLKEYNSTTNPNSVMCGTLVGVTATCSGPLTARMTTKPSTHEWIFRFDTFKTLCGVVLMEDTNRDCFHLSDVKTHVPTSIINTQEWFLENNTENGAENKTHAVKITFKSDIYGTFRQSVVFDFGTHPVLVKNLCVDVLPVEDLELLNQAYSSLNLHGTERWHYANSEIIPFHTDVHYNSSSYANLELEWSKMLKSLYPLPQKYTFVLSQETFVNKSFRVQSYKQQWHDLICIEKMSHNELISRYNISAEVELTDRYTLSPNGMANTTSKFAVNGELFALMHLDRKLSEDSPEGRLVLRTCNIVLIKKSTEDQKVYETVIEDKGKAFIYLRLSSTTVNDLHLLAGTRIIIEAQFQLNHLPYCEWHYAIGRVMNCDIIFPNISAPIGIPWSPDRHWAETLDKRLNVKQREAVLAITAPLNIKLPPILIIGPFGTGKTFTLANAVIELIRNKTNRILICTQSNSAADLYIKDYFHPLVKGGCSEARPLRIYYHKRWVSTVSPIVQQYCLIETTGTTRNFQHPTMNDIINHRIVIMTLSTSMSLAALGLHRGWFTHIFLDEAAQALECEAVMPLALADENTRIILAGDHMQITPDVFSPFAKERKLHMSLLERLYELYPKNYPCRILLSDNYRAHEAIINFTSDSFYEQKFKAKGNQPKHNLYYPLSFFTVRGEEIQDKNSTAFYNNSEVYEVVDRIMELSKNWPADWGEVSVGVLTPYSDQVYRIRSELRKKRMAQISVERVLNVQGKQFRAVFLSTVRTRATLGKDYDENDDYGFVSNSKLLNTAITRAQSLVAVVGDPVTLCSVGKCRKIWEKFVKTCAESNSFHGMTCEQLKNHLDGIELKNFYGLNPLAQEFVPKQQSEHSNRFHNPLNSRMPLPSFDSLEGFLTLLPKGMSLFEFLCQPHNFHKMWCEFLAKSHSTHAASQIEYLLHTAYKK